VLTRASALSYTQLQNGNYIIVIDAPQHEFTFQRQFNLTIGPRNDNTVFVTVCSPSSRPLF
jgi:hypothetical protein